jgi:hypothetical protein
MEKQIPLEQFMRENPDYLAISHSQIENWDRCQRLWHYVSMHKLATEVTWPMKFSGTMLHPALSRWYKSEGTELMDSAAWHECWNKYMESVQMIPCPRNRQAIYSQEHASDIIAQYVTLYQTDFTKYSFVASEEPRYRLLPGLKVIYLSIPDLVLQQINDGNIVVNDFKHSTWDTNSGLDSFDRQLLGQAFVCDANMIMKTHMFSSIKNSKAVCTITRDDMIIESDQMTEWLSETSQTAREIIEAKKYNTFVKQAPKGCFAFNKVCRFHDICLLGSLRHDVIPNLAKRERD